MVSTRNGKRTAPTTTPSADAKKRKVNTENARQGKSETKPNTNDAKRPKGTRIVPPKGGQTTPQTKSESPNDENTTPTANRFYKKLEGKINENGTIVPATAATYKPPMKGTNTAAKKIDGTNESKNTTALKPKERDPNAGAGRRSSTKAAPKAVTPQRKAAQKPQAASKSKDSKSTQAKSLTPASLPPGRKTPWPRPSTPGRVGPVLPTTFDQDYKIAPFKGPKGHKVRKTPEEKEEEYKQHVLADPTHCFHELHICFEKGPKGSPTCDKSGFELDFRKVASWMKPSVYNKAAMVRGMEEALSSDEEEEYKLRDIFFELGAQPEGDYYEWSRNADFWKDRVSKDLQIPWHHIGVKEFQMWEKKGFQKAKKGEYQNPTQEERERMDILQDGCTLRK
ncbi:hypothetical protein B0J14DRAFT_571775 [Halenospora varia]|nr:hypothetical protein B0J14DRAFT_571775 [Halenospora varia]